MPVLSPKDRTPEDLLVFVDFLRRQALELEEAAERMRKKGIATVRVVNDKSLKNAIDSLLRFTRSTLAGLAGAEDARIDLQQLLGTLPTDKKTPSGGKKREKKPDRKESEKSSDD